METISTQISTEFILFTRISLSSGHIVVNKTGISPCPHEALILWVRTLINGLAVVAQ